MIPQRPDAAIAIDARSLERLRGDAARDPRGAARQAAGQFEAMFTQMLLKSMREAMPKSGMWDGPGQSQWQSMLDAQISQQVAGRPGGLADVIARQLTRHLPAADAAAELAVSGDDPAEPALSLPAMPPVPPSAAPAEAAPSGTGLPLAPGSTVSLDGAGAVAAGLPAGAMRADAARRAWRDMQALAGVSPEAGGQRADTARADPARGGAHRSDATRADATRADAVGAPKGEGALRRAAFVQRLWAPAQAAERATGVPAGFILGQAALETGWGRSEMRAAGGANAHNLFGIKAGAGWKGPTVDAVTTEYVDGRAVRKVERFRAYGSYDEAFRDWAGLIAKSPRYAAVLRAGHTVEGFAQGLQRAGYATDPAYADKLVRTIHQAMRLQRMVVA